MTKLFGHRSLENTQIYAKVVDESKWKAVAMFPTLTRVDKAGRTGVENNEPWQRYCVF
jgi:hypothetical protein